MEEPGLGDGWTWTLLRRIRLSCVEICAALRNPAPDAEDDEDWEPPAGRLGSALNLRELDVLGRSESAGSFDAATHNFAMPPDWSPGTGAAQPPAFSFGNG